MNVVYFLTVCAFVAAVNGENRQDTFRPESLVKGHSVSTEQHLLLLEDENAPEFPRNANGKTMYENQALLDAYKDFGISEHDVANEFTLFSHATIDYNMNKESLTASNDTWIIEDISPKIIWSGEMVTVTFSTTAPLYADMIAAYSPPDIDPATTVPVKYGYCDDYSPDYLTDGKGSLTFNMTNLRAGVRFDYISGGYKHGSRKNISSSNLEYHNYNEQLRPRVIPTGSDTLDTFTVMWSSSTSTKPALKWSANAGDVTTSTPILATTDSIKKEELCGKPANEKGWRETGMIHSAEMKGMKALAGQKIFYTFGDVDTDTWSAWLPGNGSTRLWDFYVPPLPGQQPEGRPTTLIWFDDLGRGSNDEAYTWDHYGWASFNTTKNVGALVQTGAVDAIYHGGDISYATGYMAVWDFFMDMLSPMSAHVPYFTTVGNHETDWPGTTSYYTGKDSGGECSVAALKMIKQPAPATIEAPWWSYSVGLIHFIGLSSEQNFTKNSTQYMWFEEDLKNINRTETPWVIFGAHRAMYLSSSWGPDNDEGEFEPSTDIANMDLMVSNLEPLLWKYKVNLGLYGHMHAVQRQAAILEQQVVQHATMTTDGDGNSVAMHENPQSTVHYLVGTGGANLMTSLNDITPPWNERNFFKWGYARIESVDATKLTFRWIESSTNEVIDRMTITQVNPATPLGTNWTCPGASFTNTCFGVDPPSPNTDSSSESESTEEKQLIYIGSGVGALALFTLIIYRYSCRGSSYEACSLGNRNRSESEKRDSTVEMSTGNPVLEEALAVSDEIM